MGKVKANKFRFHKKASQDPNSDDRLDTAVGQPDSAYTETVKLDSNCGKNDGNIFAGININFDEIGKSLDDKRLNLETRSLSSKSYWKKQEQLLPKKEKLKRRHERFIEKLEIIYQGKNKSKKKNRNRKKNLSDDKAPLLVALSDSEVDAPTEMHKKKKKAILSRPCMKAKQRHKAEKEDVKHFFKVLNDPVFKVNPAETITQYLKAKLAEKRPDLQFQ